ncbi:MAG: DUF2298 domain-containing protein [Anaerolineaceae bacterium]|nr:DUF2298 domain-containing protein [Anaerolineaceae bacterium]
MDQSPDTNPTTSMPETGTIKPNAGSSTRTAGLVTAILLVIILGVGAYLRFTGNNWDSDTYMHPDERFLAMVTDNLKSVPSLPAYFDTNQSTLNPVNTGNGFYVYGDLPIIITHYVTESLGMGGLHDVKTVGRYLSGASDLLSVLFVFLIALQLFNRRTALLAAAFSAFAVLQIQQAHFYTTDTFANMFLAAAIFIVVLIPAWPDEPENLSISQRLSALLKHSWLWLSILFGAAAGLAVASKINTAPVVVLLPLAMLAQLWKSPPEKREGRAWIAIAYMVAGAVVCLIFVRIFQPYAFNGLGIDPKWLDNMKQLANLSSRDADYPPAMQWARRSIFYSAQNLIQWGLGIPLGLLAFGGLALAAWRMFKGEWQKYLVLWVWTAGFFAWQSLASNPTMRYQLPIYPTLAIFAGWALVYLWDKFHPAPVDPAEADRAEAARPTGGRAWIWLRVLIGVGGAAVLLATATWAFAFLQIYIQPFTRYAASEWIFQNIPGPINLAIQSSGSVYNQPISYPYNSPIAAGVPYTTNFTPNASGTLSQITLGHAVQLPRANSTDTLTLTISNNTNADMPLLSIPVGVGDLLAAAQQGTAFPLQLSPPLTLNAGQQYYLEMQLATGVGPVDLCNPLVLHLQTGSDSLDQTIASPDPCTVQPGQSYQAAFTLQNDSSIDSLSIQTSVSPLVNGAGSLSLAVTSADQNQVLAKGTLNVDSFPGQAAGQPPLVIHLDNPVQLDKSKNYSLTLQLQTGAGSITLSGDPIANEGAWDDGLPLRVDNYDGFGGIYPGNLNFDMYDDDNAQKLDRFENILGQAQFIIISSNRQWGSLTRIPERFPLSTVYYRSLLGCPPQEDLLVCYRTAQPGMFTGSLGYQLIKVFQSNPTLGPLSINDQAADEAFTVYDHPKVFIFQKTSQYSQSKVNQILESVDLSKVIRVVPGRAGSYPADLLLPAARLAVQQAGGTWAQLFNPDFLYNRYPGLALILWYLVVALLGLMLYPLVRLALPGLSDRGYPLARIAGLLLLAYLVWMGGSAGIPVTRLFISAVLAVMLVVCVFLAVRQWPDLKKELHNKRNYFLMIELLFLAFFAIDLLIRFGNPDLWHPAFGGEKPMDFSYFNAVLKSTTFPPYDPWYDGGYLNYYYYGFVVVGILVKWLGITPSVAYNLILPTLFSMLALGAFSAGWNLAHLRRPTAAAAIPANLPEEDIEPPADSAADAVVPEEEQDIHPMRLAWPFWVGLACALGMVILGNLGTVRMIWQGLQMEIVSRDVMMATGNLITRLGWTFQGLVKYISGSPLPYSTGDWYWIPSRAIIPEAGNEITEFPFFTFLYADLHAHMIALPIALLSISFALSAFLGRAHWGEADGRNRWLSQGLSLLLGGLAIGALKPTNTWDFYTYLVLGLVALGAGTWLSFSEPVTLQRRILTTAINVAILGVLALYLYQPFNQWFGQAYNSLVPWTDDHTSLSSYLTHWGLFLFVIASWMFYETIDWMAHTPVSSLNKLRKYLGLIIFLLVASAAVFFLLLVLGVAVAWVVIPLALWAAVLIIRPGQTDGKRAVLFLVGTALVITLAVELVVLKGDIGRQNTVFKFYMQAWVFFAISAGAALGWLWPALRGWRSGWNGLWRVGLVALVVGAALYPLTAGSAKIKDRMAADAPHTLDGMTYMDYSTYGDGPTNDTYQQMDLSQDYAAIQWMQRNVQGSPVLVEANTTEYKWGTRFTIYTGLPGVVGWSWHQRQQRALVPEDWVTGRISDIQDFYTTTDLNVAQAFLSRYNVSYIILGQLERIYYGGPGLAKFEAENGQLWQRVYSDKNTAIYKVIKPLAN